MKRIVCVVLTLVSLVSLFPSAVAARNGKDNIYIRILGTNGTITAGVRTTYGDDIKVGDSVVQMHRIPDQDTEHPPGRREAGPERNQRKHRWGAGAVSCRTLPGEGLHHGPYAGYGGGHGVYLLL